eukprot:7512376-Pyramimonas_sp.AAC.1
MPTYSSTAAKIGGPGYAEFQATLPRIQRDDGHVERGAFRTALWSGAYIGTVFDQGSDGDRRGREAKGSVGDISDRERGRRVAGRAGHQRW